MHIISDPRRRSQRHAFLAHHQMVHYVNAKLPLATVCTKNTCFLGREGIKTQHSSAFRGPIS